MREEYRSHVGVILAILNSIDAHEEIGITQIMLEANLPHERAKKYLENLRNEGYINAEQQGRQTLYEITEKGQEFLKSLNWTKSFFDNLGFPL